MDILLLLVGRDLKANLLLPLSIARIFRIPVADLPPKESKLLHKNSVLAVSGILDP